MSRKRAINTTAVTYADAVNRMIAWRETLATGAVLDLAGGFSTADADYLLRELASTVPVRRIDTWAMTGAELDTVFGTE